MEVPFPGLQELPAQQSFAWASHTALVSPELVSPELVGPGSRIPGEEWTELRLSRYPAPAGTCQSLA